MKRDGVCSACKYDSDDTCHFTWSGEPFGKIAPVWICSYCGFLIKPGVICDVAIIGTSSGDIYTQSEMKAEGFTDKKRLASSIKAVGKILGLTSKEISKKLKG